MTGPTMSEVTAAQDPIVTFFRDAANHGRLVLPRCGSCGRRHWYPRATCPFCLSADMCWDESPGRGRVYSFTLFRRRGGCTVIAYVELDEGLRLLTHILTDDPASVAIGQPVEVVFERVTEGDDQRHPLFRVICDH